MNVSDKEGVKTNKKQNTIKLKVAEKERQGNKTFKSELKGISGETQKKAWNNIDIKNYFHDFGNFHVNFNYTTHDSRKLARNN